MPNQSMVNVRKDIVLYLDRLSRNNTDIIHINLTHPEIKIPVVRVIMPKLISYSGHAMNESIFIQIMEERTSGQNVNHVADFKIRSLDFTNKT